MNNKLELKGRTPQSATDIEDVILGAILIDQNHETAFELLNADMFYKNENREVFKVMKQLFDNNNPVDLLTVNNNFNDNGNRKVDEKYLILLTQKISSAAHLEYYCRIVMQKYFQRGMVYVAGQLANDAYDNEKDILDLMSETYDKLNELSDLVVSNKKTDIHTVTQKLIQNAQKIYRGEITPGLPTPIDLFNKLVGGLRNDELIILAARPSMGKTAFAIKTAWQLAKTKIPTAFFSLEMSESKLLSRCWSIETGISGSKFFKEGLSEDEAARVNRAEFEVGNIPLFIEDDDNGVGIRDIILKAKKLHKEHGLKIIFIDYLQLISGDSVGKNTNREQEISKISRALKQLATALGIPVIVLSQLNRSVETRGGDKRPILSDLRESGAIEQDADVVSFIYRPEFYYIEEWDDVNYNHESTYNEAEFIIAKNRNGSLGRDRMKFIKHLTDFRNIEDFDESENATPFDPNEFIKPNNNLGDAF